MSTALALIQPTEYDLMAKLAKVAAMSGYSKQNEVQAMFIMLKGFELGISPMQALDGIQVIQGKTVVSPQLMLALINRSGLLEDIKIDPTETECTVMMKRVGRSAHTEVFTMKDAQAMQLAGKDNWKKQPATMLKWRAVSACARVVFSDVIQGMYTVEEMGGEVSEDASGELVIETPASTVVDADFTADNDKLKALVDKTPQTVVDNDGVIVEQNAPEIAPQAVSSDLEPQIENGDAVTSDSPEIAKSRFAGNGAPKNSEQKIIGRWAYDRHNLLSALSQKAKDFPYQERSNTVKALDSEKAFATCQTIDDAVRIVMTRLNSHREQKAAGVQF